MEDNKKIYEAGLTSDSSEIGYNGMRKKNIFIYGDKVKSIKKFLGLNYRDMGILFVISHSAVELWHNYRSTPGRIHREIIDNIYDITLRNFQGKEAAFELMDFVKSCNNESQLANICRLEKIFKKWKA